MKTLQLSYIFWSVVAGLLFVPASLVAQGGLSHLRVVRLSYASGTVGIRRPQSTEWAKAIVNTPIQEGSALSTSSDSFAEVEFENGSTARLGELSRVEFTQLAMDSGGNKINHLTFEEGYATFHFVSEHKDVYTVKADDIAITPRAKAEFRTDLGADQLRVEVLNGSVEIAAPSGSKKLGKDEALTFNTRTEVASKTQHGIQSDVWDKWVESRDTQAQLAQKDSAVGLKGALYAGVTSTPTVIGPIFRDTATAGLLTSLWVGRPIRWECGTGIPPLAGLGLVPNPGAGYPIIMGSGTTTPCWVGSGCRGHSRCGHRHWSIGIGDRAGSAGCQYGNGITAVPTTTLQSSGLISPNHLIPVHSWEGQRLTSQPSFRPYQETVLPGVLLAHGHVSLGSAQSKHSLPLQASFRSRPGPGTVLMGDSPGSERAVLNTRRSFWARSFGRSQPQPLRAHSATLGGGRPVGGVDLTNFEMLRGGPAVEKGTLPSGSHRGASVFGFAGSGPVVLPRGGGGLGRATMLSHGGFGGGMGGRGGFSSGLSGHVSSGTASGGHAASGGSGRH